MSVSDKQALIDNHIDDIAIIAMHGRFPGANDVEQFWQNLENSVESITFFSRDDLLQMGVNPTLLENPNFVAAEGMIDGLDMFDAEFFGISPREAEMIDPQHRIFLETAYQLLEIAGYGKTEAAGEVGVYCGAGASSYLSRNLLSHPEYVANVGTFKVSLSTGQDFAATRVSYKLGLTGPSINVNTLCSSSLVAVHYAREALLAYQCDMAIAGGVTISASREDALFYQEGGIGAFDGHCRAFDSRAAGTVAGNGIALVALKRMEDALNDNDQIMAVLKGSAINNDGADKASYTAPSPQGQSKCIAEAMEIAGVEPDTIGYIEAHGTGTNLGDPIEIAGLTRAFRTKTDKNQYCGIGSVKTNIGHLVSAGGVASLIKTAMGMQHQTIPANLNFDKPNPKIDFANSPFYVANEKQAWLPVGGSDKLRAGISSFGIGGTNAHVVIEQAPVLAPTDMAHGIHTIVLSAKTATALKSQKADLAAFLQRRVAKGDTLNIADIAYTLQLGRKDLEHKYITTASDVQMLIDNLNQGSSFDATAASREHQRNICFMFSGQGNQYIGMGRELYLNNPVYKQHLDKCFDLLKGVIDFDLKALMFPAAGEEASAEQQLRQTCASQVALFAVEYSIAQLWQHWGIKPAALIGHSIGELVAACIAGVFTLSDGLKIVAKRGELMQAMAPGKMLSVTLSEQSLQAYLADDITFAVQNSELNNILSGPAEAIDALAERLADEGIGAVELFTSHAFHSPMMSQAAEQFADFLKAFELKEPQLPIVSNVDGQWLDQRAQDSNYWAQQLLSTVRFADGIKHLIEHDGEQVFLEVGPGHSLCAMVKAQEYAQQRIINSLPHPKKATASEHAVALAVGRIWGAGIKFDWQQLYQAQERGRVALPAYPFERRRYWIKQAPHGSGDFRPDAVIKDMAQVNEQGMAAVANTLMQFKCDSAKGAELNQQQLAELLALADQVKQQVANIVGSDFDVSHSGVEVKHQSVDESGEEDDVVQGKMTAASVTNERPNSAIEYVEPSGETQKILATHWQEVLGYKPVGAKDDFFEMGGHSLMVASVVARLRKTFKVEIPLAELMNASSVELLADLIDTKLWIKENQAQGDTDEQQAEQDQEVLEL